MSQVFEIPLRLLSVSSQNVRKDLSAGQEDASLDELAQSISAKGLISPLTVRKAHDETFEVVSGQRRFLACKKIGHDPVRCIVRNDLTDNDAATISLVENVHRADMHPLDKAKAFNSLYKAHGTYDAVAREVALTAATVKKYLLLLRLPEEIRGRMSTDGGAVRIGALSRLAERFEGDDAIEVWEKIAGFSGKIAETIIQRSGGNLSEIDNLVFEAQEGAFDTKACGGKYGCETIREILEREMTVSEFNELVHEVSSELNIEVSTTKLKEASKLLWKVLARG